MTAPMLEIRNLEAWYGPSQALHGVDLRVRDGEVVALLGRNGAGKSTLLKSIMGMMPRTRGSIRFRGRELSGLPAHRIGRAGIGFCPDDRGIYASLSVLENLRLPPRLGRNGIPEGELLEMFPNLSVRRAGGSQLSGGEQQMLAMARILRSGARFLLLDEPTEGLAPIIVEQIHALIGTLKSRGYTMILVEQNVHFAAALADRHYLIEGGRAVREFDASSLAQEFESVAARLGV